MKDIANIRFGLHVVPIERGNILYLQVRQFDEEGRWMPEEEEYISYDEKSAEFLLKDGDVLFVGKGNRLFAWCYREEYGPAVASSIFFVLRPKSSAIYPEYLAAVLNAPQSKSAFRQLGGGTNIFSIRKSELGALEITVPPLKRQQQIVAFSTGHAAEIRIAEEMIRQKKELYKIIMSKIIR
ncbi:restriction endonuclease subunit S [Chitinophaga cymbidii]|uniref:restriction endonuclease subunit S n=1 Tax=Chitinophaga cymbidii TaxID=1096750 RepID=UPI00164B1FD8|nr:restriction endonuclease subunit S [Chitinophaga cymbidii]